MLHRLGIGLDGVEPPAEAHLERAQAPHCLVQHGDPGAEAHGHAGGLRADHAGAEDHHLAGRNARNAAQKHAPTALRLLQAVGADLHRHSARHLAHGREQRQSPVLIGHGFIGNGNRARVHQPLGLIGIGAEVKVGEQRLALAQHLVFLRLRLLDLDDHLGGLEDLGRGCGDRGARRLVIGVRQSEPFPGPGLDHDFMLAPDELAHAGRDHGDAVFVGLDLLGHPYQHFRHLLIHLPDAAFPSGYVFSPINGMARLIPQARASVRPVCRGSLGAADRSRAGSTECR